MTGTVTANSPIDKALALQARGFHVFPCIVEPKADGSGKTDKRPLTGKGGHHNSSNDPVRVELMFKMAPDATHVGIDCVKNGIDVLDIDTGDGETFYQANKHLVPNTLHARTGSGGRHLFYKGDPNRGLKQGAYLGIDTRLCKPTGGGWVVAWEPAAFYDLDKIANSWPDEFIRLANARPARNGNGHTIWLQPPTNQSPSRINVADEIREYARLGHVPIGSRDLFVIGVCGHAQKALHEGMATIEQVAVLLGRVSGPRMMSGDQVKTFRNKLVNAKFTPEEVDRLVFCEGVDDGLPPEPFPVNVVARAQQDFAHAPPVREDPFEGYESVPGGQTGFGEPTPTRFTFESGDTLTFDPAAQASLVSGVLPVLGTGALAGKPAAKKSFIAIDFAACIAGNKPWGGRDVMPGLVVYIAAEGQGGMAKRLTACFTKRGLSAVERRNVLLLRVAPNLGVRGGDAAALVGAIRVVANGVPVRMIVVDTLVRTLGGAEENGMGMASFMDNATQIATELGTFVLAIHHPSKGDEVLRGHSSLEGGLDVVLSVSSEKGLLESSMFVHKDKDGEDGVTHVVEFERVVLGADKQGQPVSTLVVKDVRYMAGAGANAPASVSVDPSSPVVQAQVLDIVHERVMSGQPARVNAQSRSLWLNRIVEQRTQWGDAVIAKVISRMVLRGLIVESSGLTFGRKGTQVYVLSPAGEKLRKRVSAPHEGATEFNDI